MSDLPCPCGQAVTECPACEHYRCAGCKRWLPWSFGAADDFPELCDDCWVVAHNNLYGPPPDDLAGYGEF